MPLYESLESFIVRYHGPNEFNSVKASVKEIHDLREEIASLTCYDDPILLQKMNKVLLDYYVALSFLNQKFKFGDDEGAVNITWPWKDSLTGEQKFSNKGIAFELNSVLYNLGAVINNMGTHTPIEADSIKFVS